MVRSKESTGDVGIVFDDDDDISGVNVSRTKGVSSPSSFVSLIIITFDDAIFFVGIGLDLFFVAELTTVAIKIAFASKHFSAAAAWWWWWWFCRRGVGVIDTLLDKSGLAGKTISLSSLCAFRTNPNGFFGATSSM